jgi:signal transduction histidine kinase
VPGGIFEVLARARQEESEQEECFRDGCGNEFCLVVRHAAVPPGESGGEGVEPSREGERPERKIASVFILRDGSEAKRLLREKEKSRREQALAEMSAILAHEIRNPLGSLELFAGLLAGSDLSAECAGWVEHVQAGLRTLAATVNNVLHFHSLPAPERAPLDMGEWLTWAEGFLRPIAREAGVELRLHSDLRGVSFAADRHRLEQVLLNLALNGLRAMPGGGTLEIAGERVGLAGERALEIAVSDTGPGIPAGGAEKLFEPGYSTRPGSPGLGLAVCRRIVAQHGGAIRAENRAGGGARFVVHLPFENGRKAATEAGDESSVGGR